MSKPKQTYEEELREEVHKGLFSVPWVSEMQQR